MKYILWVMILGVVLSFKDPNSIYELKVSDIDSNPVELSGYKGKKMIIIVLPVTPDDTSVTISEITKLEKKYTDSLIILGVPASDLGYTPTFKSRVKDFYKGRRKNFILLEAMNVKKSADADQSVLFQWLTDRSKNQRFDKDVQGPGTKFLVDRYGNLVSVLSPAFRLSNPIFEKVVTNL